MSRKLYAVVYEDNKEVVSRGGSSTPYTLRVFKTLEEAKRSIKRKRGISGNLKIIEYVESKVLEE